MLKRSQFLQQSLSVLVHGLCLIGGVIMAVLVQAVIGQ